MSAPRPVEADLLGRADSTLTARIAKLGRASYESRLQILEACAARFGGFDLARFHRAFGIESIWPAPQLLETADEIAAEIQRTPIHPALALSALAREELTEASRKKTGAYHTDFRLAQHLAQLAARGLTPESKVIDPACGTGILLVALTLQVCGMDRRKIAAWLANGLFAADLSANSMRGALLSLASLTDDLTALSSMRSRWYLGDSLLASRATWDGMARGGFDAVVGNPPWEKVKLTRHEFLRAAGEIRHYGAATTVLDTHSFDRQRQGVASYARQLLERYPGLSGGEPDLYIAFTELFSALCRPGGTVAALVPGGLIRSQGTELIRRRLFETARRISISVMDNRARFFEIDTRFKFLALVLVRASGDNKKRAPVKLLHEKGTAHSVETNGEAVINRSTLFAIRPDLSFPEVRSATEWRIFQKVAKAGCGWADPAWGWAAQFCREVDMTKERPKFLSAPTQTSLPLVEGRMVHQYRFGAKGYRSGSGRRAVWERYPVGGSRVRPQFWIEPADVPMSNVSSASKLRAGFCDIAGQTNERSLMATIIPAGVVCGNKVPTVLFPEDPAEERLLAFIAVANSIVFDWMLRRVLTTTVNYFLLQSIPLPKLARDGLPWKRIVTAARELVALNFAGASAATSMRVGQLRAFIDAEVAVAYRLSLSDLRLMLGDFPSLDRGQPTLPHEIESTITRDTLLAAAAKRMNVTPTSWKKRTERAVALGAVPYVPSEIALGVEQPAEEIGGFQNVS